MILDCMYTHPLYYIIVSIHYMYTSRYLHLDTYFVDPAHEMYQYPLWMAPCELQHVGV
jgi:hypothetical protein